MTIETDLSMRALAHDIAGAHWFSHLPGEHMAIRIAGEQAGGRLSMLECVVEPSAGPPLHIHHGMDEVFYVLAGELRFACGRQTFDAEQGGIVLVPKGTPHCFRNLGRTPARMLVITTPGGIENLFESLVGRSAADIPMLAEQWGTSVVGPPLAADAALR